MQIIRSGSQPATKGPAEWFTGNAAIEPVISAEEPARVQIALVTFQPGARTVWHTHPLGQTLIITSGVGVIQVSGCPVEIIQAGDVVWTPPGVKHWHGAAEDLAMSHYSITEKQDGRSVDWMERVSDEQYNLGCAACRQLTSLNRKQGK